MAGTASAYKDGAGADKNRSVTTVTGLDIARTIAVDETDAAVPQATSTLQTTANTKLDTLHTDMAAVLAKIIAAPATETTVAAILAKIIAAPATEATLASVLAGVIAATPAGTNEIGKVNWTHFNTAASALTRPANATPYTINDSISDNATAGSVTANSVSLSDTNDAPLDLTEILLDTTDTGPGTAGALIRLHLFNSDPTASTGVVGGDNAAWSNKRAGWVGSFSGTMRLFSDGSRGVLIPDEGSVRIANPVSGAKTYFWQLQTLTAFTPSANSTTFTPRFKGFQGRS